MPLYSSLKRSAKRWKEKHTRLIEEIQTLLPPTRQTNNTFPSELCQRCSWPDNLGISINNVGEIAAHVGVDRKTVRRAQNLTARTVFRAEEQELTKSLQAAKGFVVIKRMWDETALRIAGSQTREHNTVKAGRRREVVVQSLQQQCLVAWGVDESSTALPKVALLALPMTLVHDQKATTLFKGVDQVLPSLCVQSLRALSATVPIALVMNPDALAANALVMAQYAVALPNVLIWQGRCGLHQLHIVCTAAFRPLDLVLVLQVGKLQHDPLPFASLPQQACAHLSAAHHPLQRELAAVMRFLSPR